MTAPKPLTAGEVVDAATILAEVQFGYRPTPTQQYRAHIKVSSMSASKFAEDTDLIIGIAIGWSSSSE